MTIQTILLTGGGSGIGGALAQALAIRGCRVIISGRRPEALEEVAADSEKISICTGDVTDAAHRAELVAALAASPEPRSIVHAAGYFQTGLLDNLSIADWRRSFDTNVTARWELTRDCANLLVGGRVLFVGSDAGANPRAGAAAYSIAQSASETLRKAIQSEWADRDIAVSAFKPGLVDTDLVRGFMKQSTEDFPSRDDYQTYISNGQIASPETIARFAAWLLLDVPVQRYSSTEWDVRQSEHHAEWCDGPLYPPRG